MRYILEEAKGLENQAQLLTGKINRLREALALENDPSTKMKYEYDLSQAEGERRDVLEKIRQVYDISTPEGQTLLEEKIIQLLHIENELGRLYLVNCDRSDMCDAFWNRYDDFSRKDQHFQFYFIAACNTQMPQSFSERMVYELIEEELDSAEDSILALWKGEEREKRLQIEELPLGRNLEKSREKFKTEFAKRFELKDNQSFEDFLKTGIPHLGHNYVTTVFTVQESHWKKDFFPEYLDWILQSFSDTPREAPFFLFYFAFYLDGMHERLSDEQQKFLDALEKLIEKHTEACLLKPLLPVPKKDLDEWMLSLGEDNPSRRTELVQAFVKGLDTKLQERFHRDGLIDMDRVIRLQELIYNYYHKPKGNTL